MSQNQQPPKKRREMNALDDKKLHLFAKAPLREGGMTPRLRIILDENNPVVDVDLGMKTEGRNGKEGYPISIKTPMAIRPLRQFLNLVIYVARQKGEFAMGMDNWGYPFMWDKDLGKNVRSKDRLLISHFEIMKRGNGAVTLGVAAKGKDTVEFDFASDEFHPVTQNGQAVDITLDSASAAVAWAEQLLETITHLHAAGWEEPEWQKQRRLENARKHNGGGGGNGSYGSGNSGNSNGGNYPPRQSQPAPQQAAPAYGGGGDVDSFDEEIPF